MSARTGGRNFREAETPPPRRQNSAGQSPLQRFHDAHAAGLGRGTRDRGAGHLSARLLSIGEGKTGVAAVETDWTWRQRIGRSCEPAVGLAVRELGGLNQPQ